MSDLLIEQRYGLPEFEFEAPDGWEYVPLSTAALRETATYAVPEGAPDVLRDEAFRTMQRFYRKEQGLGLVVFDDPARGQSRTWLAVSALTAPDGKHLGELAQTLVRDHDAVFLDQGRTILRWHIPEDMLRTGGFALTRYLIPSPTKPQTQALYITGWAMVMQGDAPLPAERIQLVLANQSAIVLSHRWLDYPRLQMNMDDLAAGQMVNVAK